MTAKAGHNSIVVKDLTTIVERIERLNDEIKNIQEDRKDIFAEARSRGYDTKTIRALIQVRKLDTEVYREQRALLDTYLAAFGVDI